MCKRKPPSSLYTTTYLIIPENPKTVIRFIGGIFVMKDFEEGGDFDRRTQWGYIRYIHSTRETSFKQHAPVTDKG